MDVAIAGGHGQIALRLARLLSARGDTVRALIRNPDHVADVSAAGAQAVVCDLEAPDADVAAAIDGADAVVFAAGAGPGSGAERKRTMDFEGAVRLLDAARQVGTRRYVMVSSIGADDPEAAGEPVFRAYLEAKKAADDAVRASGLAYTIVRPGRLTDDPGHGLIAAVVQTATSGEIPRDDVAATLAAVLAEPRTAGLTFDLLSGDVPIAEAVTALADRGP
jgi:uncharacterized protein YbjT (DUF2867 family)